MKLKRGDWMIIILVIVAGLAFMIPRYWPSDQTNGKSHNNKTYAKISVDGKEFKTVELTQEEQIIEVKSDHGLNIIKVHDYGVEMTDADCPDEVCLTFGFVTKPGQNIVCLPHRVLVEVIGDGGTQGDDEIDAST
ncbi:NusG domain II-containing protein [Paenibacillus larvae]|nr:NusG domain II-containing protein [Paenibacillus larvae]AQZ46671.1 hypothetical protein B5S25_08645 [Paenibacillus larvae subsp. pulvifaciens]MBH0343493.1 hypothetical protein [Paenibacillus larvae]MCY7520963.1 NusG domain II-containing protein [Paenibacillus larvae]MCY9499228.1 NusG domain II-containing protein [Paenibacillus larvae]MCY9679164.1 NusG domain II-containing protein [Paenibacillus larvae]